MPEIQFDALRIKYAEYLKRGNHCRVIMTYCASITQIKFKWNKAYFLLHYFLSSLNITFFSFFLSQFHYSLSFFLDLFLRFLFSFFYFPCLANLTHTAWPLILFLLSWWLSTWQREFTTSECSSVSAFI